MQADSEDRSAAAFLVTSVLESQRHPELQGDEHDSLKNSREFVAWAVSDAIERGELTTDTDVSHLVEMLVAVMWGMGFYAGFVGNHERTRPRSWRSSSCCWPTSSGNSTSNRASRRALPSASVTLPTVRIA